MPQLWGTNDVADYLGIPVGTLYQWRTRGFGPPGKRVGKYVRFKPGDVEAWFDQLPEGVI